MGDERGVLQQIDFKFYGLISVCVVNIVSCCLLVKISTAEVAGAAALKCMQVLNLSRSLWVFVLCVGSTVGGKAAGPLIRRALHEPHLMACGPQHLLCLVETVTDLEGLGHRIAEQTLRPKVTRPVASGME